MIITMDPKDYIGKRCVVNSHGKRYGGKFDFKYGTIERPGSSTVGIKLDGERNEASGYGAFWFHKGEVELLKPLDQMIVEMPTEQSEVHISGRFKTVNHEVVLPLSQRGYSVVDHTVDLVKYEMEDIEMATLIADRNLRIVELAKERDLKAVSDTVTATINGLVDADEVIAALNVKRINEEKKPLSYAQKITLVCEETEKLIQKAKEESIKEEHAINVKYEELYAALALPECNVIEVLKAAGVLNADGTGLA